MHNHAFRSIGDNVTIYPMARIIGAENLEIGSNVIIDDFVLIQASRPCYIGNYVHIASFTSITGGGSFCLEDFSTLSSGIRFFTGTDDFLGTGMANSTIPDEYRNVTRSTTILRTHGIVGANTTVLAGVTIGTGAAIGAGSLVRKSLPPWQVYAGNPLRTLKERPRDNILRQEQELYAKYGMPKKSYRDVL